MVLMKKRYLGTILLFVFVLCGGYSKDNQKQTTTIDEPNEEILLATDENFVKTMNGFWSNYVFEIDSKLEGNFTNSGFREILVFFNGKPEKHNESRSWDALVFIVDEQNEIVNFYQSSKLYQKKNTF